jgi:LytS/YehU family sensor histidine kinase
VDAEVLDAQVPNLILQPLVENAVRHGIARRRETGRIRLSAWRDGDRLEIRVRDNGPGLAAEGELLGRSGVGLANTQARLRQLYGSKHRFELVVPESGGVEVTLSIPYRTPPVTVPGVPRREDARAGVAALPMAAPVAR